MEKERVSVGPDRDMQDRHEDKESCASLFAIPDQPPFAVRPFSAYGLTIDGSALFPRANDRAGTREAIEK